MTYNLQNFRQLAYRKKCQLILGVLLLQITQLKAELMSQSFDLSTNYIMEPVQDQHFQQLKKKVLFKLQGTWCSEKKADLMMDLIYQTRPKVCVEIGVFGGSSLLPVAATLKHLKQGHLYGVDAWSNEQAVKYMSTEDPNYTWWSKVNMSDAKKACEHLIHAWGIKTYCSLIHAASESAIHQIPEIDFLHLDGNFCEEGSLLDVRLFLPKVKSGGYILLSNLYQQIDGKFTRMPAMWELFDSCEIIWNVDPNVVLFRKS